jgi:carboxyl-terminal processing protease
MRSILLTLLIPVCLLFSAEDEKADYYKELSDNIKLYFDILLTLNENYVDTVNIEEMMSEGIKAMLSTTDPYTVLLKESEVDHYTELSSGTYGGIGIYLGTSGPEKRLTVISPMDDTPASKVGLKAGDMIMYINEKETKGISTKDASDYLRGDPGTKVTLKIKRPGRNDLLNFSLTRARINILNVPYSEVIDGSVGYIKLTQFTATSYYDFVKEFEILVSQGVKSLIIDLRYNPGGLLESAVKHTSAFLPKNKLVVSTKGRGDRIDNEYLTQLTPLDTEIPVAVLINNSSASASEIFAGALQDHDRAVIVGEGSFGKGLVQQLFDVGMMKKRNMKVTVRKYYTPNGRLIQKEDYFGDRSENEKDPVFFSSLINKRKMPSGTGILPDVFVEEAKDPDYISFLKMNNLFSDFLYNFYLKNPDYKFKGINDGIVQKFKDYIASSGFKYESSDLLLADSLLSYSRTNDYPSDLIKNLEETREKLAGNVSGHFEKNINRIKHNLAIEFGVYTNGNKEKYRIMNTKDPVIAKAKEILKDKAEYKRILGYK